MLRWLRVAERNPNTHICPVCDYTEQDGTQRQRMQEVLGKDVLRNYRSTADLMADLEDLGLNQIAGFVKRYVIPNPDSIVWIGEFGEVTCGHLIRKHWRLTMPELKLRHKQVPSKAMFLTDIVAFKFSAQPQDSVLLVGEVKTITTRNRTVAVEGYKQLEGVTEERLNEDLLFIRQHLRKSGRIWLLAQVNRLFNPHQTNVKLRYDLFLVHDSTTWNEDVLDQLDANGVAIAPFQVHVMRIDQLKDFMLGAYELSVKRAEAMVGAAGGGV